MRTALALSVFLWVLIIGAGYAFSDCTSGTTGSFTYYSCDDGRTGTETRVGPYTTYSGSLYGDTKRFSPPLRQPARPSTRPAAPKPLFGTQRRFGEPRQPVFGRRK